jgi:YegS/Rv2252/BmrU family lipid kinase
LVIFNPVSGLARYRIGAADLALELDRAGIDFELRQTQAAGDAERMVIDAYAEGWRHFAVAGGDGTAHLVINGLMAAPGVEADRPTLAILPLGTGNDWARSLGVSRNLRRALATLVAGCAVASDVGRVTFFRNGRQCTRFFVNASGAGFDAHVVRAISSRPSGRLQYLAGLARVARGFRAPTLGVKIRGYHYSAPTLAVLVSNGAFLGGGLRIAPDARYDDGLLNVAIVEAVSFARIIANIPRLLFGSLGESRHVRALEAAELEIEGNTRVQADGELLGYTPVRIGIIPNAIRVIVDAHQQGSQEV